MCEFYYMESNSSSLYHMYYLNAPFPASSPFPPPQYDVFFFKIN